MPLEERQALPSDASWLWHLYVDLLKESIEEQWGWNEGFQQEMFSTHLPAEEFRIIQTGTTPLAAYLVNKDQDHHYVKMLLVDRTYQRQGIGKNIIQQLKRDALIADVPLKLNVIKANPALDFYLKLGFSIDQQSADNILLSYIP